MSVRRETVQYPWGTRTVYREVETGRFARAIQYIFAWHALSDACPKCAALNGKEWRDQDLFQSILWDPVWGNLWNLDEDHSMAHGEFQYNCRCQLEVRVDFRFEEMKDLVEFSQLVKLL